MTELVTFEGFSLRPQGQTLTLGLGAGRILGIYGQSGSGKTRLLRTVLGQEKPAQGAVHVPGSVAIAGTASFSRRSTPQTLARRYSGRKADEAGAALHETQLWKVKDEPLSSLPSGALAACELLPVLCVSASVIVVDGQLDRLDPWARSSVLEALRKRAVQGSALLIVTSLPDLATQFDLVLVLKDGRAAFAGTADDLLRQTVPYELTVSSENQPGVLALAKPFSISVQRNEGSVVLKAQEGQQLAAKLLLEGYGDVKYVVVKQPTITEALVALE